jgi:hypothetical protein
MNRERDIERVLDAWLQPGPTVMPDRLFDDVLERIDRQPQRRLARLQTRITTMRPTTLFAVAAALVVAVGAGIVLLGRPSAPDVAAPTPVPSVAPAPSASPAATPTSPTSALPAELRHRWIGAPRAIPEARYADTAIQLLDLGPTGYAQVSLGLMPPIMPSTPSPRSGDQLQFVTAIGDDFCEMGMVGDYRWDLSPDGMTLTLEAAQDACAPRAAAFSGTWTRSACRDHPYGACLGIVPAGTYISTILDVRSAPGRELSRGAYGQLGYTVPGGWANLSDWPDVFALVPAIEYAGRLGDPENETDRHGIYVHARPAAAGGGDGSCSTRPAPGVGTSAADLAAFMAAHPALEASAPTPVTVGDLTGTMVDIRLRSDWTGTCPDLAGDTPAAPLLAERGGAADPWDWGIIAGERLRLIFVDIGGGATISIAIDDSSSPSRFDELVAAAMPVIATFEFPEQE